MATSAEQRLLDELRRQALELPAGTRLPSMRELSARHRASPVTVAGAVARLAAEGLAIPRPGRGTFVAERADPSAPAPDLAWQAVALGPATVDSGGLEALLADGSEDAILLSSGFPGEELLPVKALAAATARAARRPGVWGRPPTEGTEELRSWFARDTGAAVDPADVVITAGAQAALAT